MKIIVDTKYKCDYCEISFREIQDCNYHELFRHINFVAKSKIKSASDDIRVNTHENIGSMLNLPMSIEIELEDGKYAYYTIS